MVAFRSMHNMSSSIKKNIILWGGMLSGIVLSIALFVHGESIDADEHPFLMVFLFPLFIWFVVSFYVVLLELIAEFKWKLLIFVLLLPFPIIFLVVFFVVFAAKLSRDTYCLMTANDMKNDISKPRKNSRN